MRPEDNALLVVDVQNDFCEGGALAVSGGADVVAPINALMLDYRTVVLSQDWHPDGHSSFASRHPGTVPLQTIDMPYGPQVLWPDHCVQGSAGAAFHPALDSAKAHVIVRKGADPAIDSYSAFFENDHVTTTGLDGYLRTRGVASLTVVGLALDFCVAYSAIDAARLGFAVEVPFDLCRAINMDGSLDAAVQAMTDAGVRLIA